MGTPKSLIEAMAGQDAAERGAAAGIYRELLQRGDSTDFTPQDQARFRRAAELLGKDLGQVQLDFRAVEQARGLKALVETLPQAESDYAVAAAALEAHDAETAPIIQERKQARGQLGAAQFDAHWRRANANDAMERLTALKQQHGQILEGIDAELPPGPPPEAEAGPFVVFAPTPRFTDTIFGVEFVGGRGETRLASRAKLCADCGKGFTVHDLSGAQAEGREYTVRRRAGAGDVFNGTAYGVRIENNVGRTSDEHAAAALRRFGYEISAAAPQGVVTATTTEPIADAPATEGGQVSGGDGSGSEAETAAGGTRRRARAR